MIINRRFLSILPSAIIPAISIAGYKAILLQPSGYDSTRASGNGVTQVGRGLLAGTENWHPMMWTGSASSAVDLLPAGYATGAAASTRGSEQFGWAQQGGDFSYAHAFIWHGSAGNGVDLNPDDFFGSDVSDSDGVTQVGSGISGDLTSGRYHALMWKGTAESYIDVNPKGFDNSRVDRISGNSQVGNGYVSVPYPLISHSHALLWHGTAASAIDLNPVGMSDSWASDVFGDIEIGSVIGQGTGNRVHAYLWNGSDGSGIDLNPTNYTLRSAATAMAGKYIVGYGERIGANHALIFRGGTGLIDLQNITTGLTYEGQYLDIVQTFAYGVDAEGNVVGSGLDDYGHEYALLWKAVPEPGPMLAMGAGLIGLMLRRKRG